MIEEEGTGWRLAKDSLRGEFPVLIGGNFWSTELTENEWNSLMLLLIDLIKQHDQYKNQLMKEELITLEIEREPWWACIDGGRESWSLKLILSGDRRNRRGIEMYWPIPEAQAFVSAMRTMWDSSQ